MSEPKIQFKIQPGATRPVERSEHCHATLYFAFPTVEAPTLKNNHKVKVNGLTVKMDFRLSPSFDDGKLLLDRFGLYGGANGAGANDLIDRLLSEHDEATIREAFRQLAVQLAADPSIFPRHVIDLFDPNGTPIPLKTRAFFTIQPATTRTWTDMVAEKDDLFFDVEDVIVPEEDIGVKVDTLAVKIGTEFHMPYFYSHGSGAILYLKQFGWYSDHKEAHSASETRDAITNLRAKYSDELIQEAFQQLALEVIGKTNKNKRKLPPADAQVWTPSIVTEIDLSKRLKTAEIKSESMTE